jgi:LuxR family maltose regulon positive regulatory protein
MATATLLHAVPDPQPELRPPFRPLQPGCVRRPRLVRRLSRSPAPLAVLVAPAGYGKTTLLQQWAEADARPFAWLTAIPADNDPVHLFGAMLEQLDDPMVLILDDAHLLHAPAALDALRALAEHTAPGSMLVLSSRGESALPLGRLRAQGPVEELGASDLAMTDVEATTFLRHTGLRLTESELDLIVRRADGWPVGLRLAVLSLCEQDDLRSAVERFAGDDRFIAEYVRDELLSELDPEDVAFLMRVSPLEPLLTGPLCDAVLDRRGSGRVLRELAHTNLPLAALDRSEECFRAHPLLVEMLRGELRRAQPAAELEIHRRASAWHEAQGELDQAIDHATAARDAARSSVLLWRAAPAYAAKGRCGALATWLDRFDDADIAARPGLALTAALRCLAEGDRDAAERWGDAAERGMTPADTGLAAGLALVRAAVGRAGTTQMAGDAERAFGLAGPDSPLRPLACVLAGAAHGLGSDRGRARDVLEEGLRLSGSGASVVRALCLAQLALLAVEEGDAARGLELADRARRWVTDADDLGLALVFAASALAYALSGRVADARRDVREARRLLAAQAAVAPWAGAQVRMVLARAELRLSDAGAARELLGEASRLARGTPDAVALHQAIADGWERADAFAAGAVAGPTSLTMAELRVLRFLPSHLSFREIALRLHVSANTVKSQAHAVYRKLDASSRSEAVARARDVGLVDG